MKDIYSCCFHRLQVSHEWVRCLWGLAWRTVTVGITCCATSHSRLAYKRSWFQIPRGGRAGTPACATDPGKVSGHFFPLLPQVPHWQANSSFSCVEQTPQIHCGHVCQTVSYTYTHGFLWKNVFPCRCKTFRALTEFSVRKTALQPKLPGSLYLFIHSTNFSENIPCLNA